MINANELRLGNWVKDRGGKFIRIDFFDDLRPEYSCKFGMTNPLSDDLGPFHPLTEYTDYANPIPLTPEILEKAGFEKEKDKIDVFHKERLRIWNGCWGESIAFLIEEDTTTGHWLPKPVKYLHQLQNLYFALTGNELDINL